MQIFSLHAAAFWDVMPWSRLEWHIFPKECYLATKLYGITFHQAEVQKQF